MPGGIAPPKKPTSNSAHAALFGGGGGGGSFGSTPIANPFTGGGGGGSGGGSYVPTPFQSNVQTNPQIDALMGEMEGFQKNLSAGTDRDATNAMQRQRDLASGQMKEFGAMAGGRGVGPGSGAFALLQRRGLDNSNRNLMGLNAQMAGDARNKQMQMFSQRSGTALGQAGVTLGQQQYGLSQWQAQQQAAQAASQLQAMQNQNMWNNMMNMWQMQGSAQQAPGNNRGIFAG